MSCVPAFLLSQSLDTPRLTFLEHKKEAHTFVLWKVRHKADAHVLRAALALFVASGFAKCLGLFHDPIVIGEADICPDFVVALRVRFVAFCFDAVAAVADRRHFGRRIRWRSIGERRQERKCGIDQAGCRCEASASEALSTLRRTWLLRGRSRIGRRARSGQYDF
jgi:hypothetical protein